MPSAVPFTVRVKETFARRSSRSDTHRSYRTSLNMLLRESTLLLEECKLIETGDLIISESAFRPMSAFSRPLQSQSAYLSPHARSSTLFWLEKDKILRRLESEVQDLALELDDLKSSGSLPSGRVWEGKYSRAAFERMLEQARNELARSRALISRGLKGVESRAPIIDEEIGVGRTATLEEEPKSAFSDSD